MSEGCSRNKSAVSCQFWLFSGHASTVISRYLVTNFSLQSTRCVDQPAMAHIQYHDIKRLSSPNYNDCFCLLWTIPGIDSRYFTTDTTKVTLRMPRSWQNIVSTTAPERAVLSVLSLGVALWTGQSGASEVAETCFFLASIWLAVAGHVVLFWLWLPRRGRRTAPVDSEIQRKICEMLEISVLKGYQVEALYLYGSANAIHCCVCRLAPETLRVLK